MINIYCCLELIVCISSEAFTDISLYGKLIDDSINFIEKSTK